MHCLVTGATGFVGGHVVDRLLEQRATVLALCVAILTVLVAFETVQMWHLYVLAGVFGIMGAFFQPAYLSMVPRLLAKEQVPAGNAVLFATSQLTGVAGPILAGYVIKVTGIATAFGLDAASYLFAAAALAGMQGGSSVSAERVRPSTVIRDIGVALRWLAGDPIMRPLLITVAAVNLLMAGPLSVGLPVLAHTRFSSDPAALGSLLSCLGAGALVGMVLGASLRPQRRRGPIVLAVLGCAGLVLATLGLAPGLILTSVATATIGLLVGFVVVTFFSWLQVNVARELMGRVMSLVVFAAALFIPASNVMAGALADRQPSLLFLLAGSLIIGVVVIAALNRSLREID